MESVDPPSKPRTLVQQWLRQATATLDIQVIQAGHPPLMISSEKLES